MQPQQYITPLRPLLTKLKLAITNKLALTRLAALPIPYIACAIIVTALLLLLSFLFNPFRTKDRTHTLLILGISGEAAAPSVGKTSLFTVLRDGSLPKHGTVPSTQPNHAAIKLPSSNTFIRVVDYPGHPRLFYNMPEYLSQAKAIVFVVDGALFSTQARRDASLLHDILTNPDVASNATPVMVFTNKVDSPKCSKVATVKVRLQAELDRIRTARASNLRTAGVVGDAEGEEQRAFLGYENEAFAFEHAAAHVSFASGSAITNDVDAIFKFATIHFL